MEFEGSSSEGGLVELKASKIVNTEIDDTGIDAAKKALISCDIPRR